jgi:ribonuclease D
MIAAQILGYEQLGLAAMLEHHFGVVLDKSLTKHDWGARPLAREHLRYLVEDVLHLEALAERLMDELDETDREEEAAIEFRRVAALTWSQDARSDPEAFRSIKGARDLDHDGLSVLRELHRLRERIAEKLDRPAFKVIGNSQLLEIAARRPTSSSALRRIPGVTERVLSRMGRELLEAVRQGVARRGEVPFRLKPPARRRRDLADAIDDALRLWRKSRVAIENKPPLVVLPNHVIARLADERPRDLDELSDIEGLGEKRRRLYGQQILDVLRRVEE